MSFKDIVVGTKVINKTGEIGIIISVGDHIVVDYGNRTAKLVNDALLKGFLKLVDKTAQAKIDVEIERLKENEKKAAEERKIADEEARKKAAEAAKMKAAERSEKKTIIDKAARKKNEGKKSGPVHPYIDERRRENKPVIFLVCQNNTYNVESRDGYIWAPDNKAKGTKDFSSHAEMDQIKKGDIIVHHFANRIWAISVAKSDCERKAAGVGHPSCGEIGRYAELSYHFLKNPADTSNLKNDKIAYGSMQYGPFDKNGNNKQGFYLSELANQIAFVFFDAAIVANPTDIDLLSFKNII